MLKVINIGNVPAMGIGVPSNRRGARCVFGGLDSSGDWSIAGRL